MRIDSIAQQADRAGRFLVKFSDGSTMRLYRQTVEDFGLYTGMELSQQELEKLCREAGAISAKMRAVRILAASNVSKSDLQQRLIQKGEDKEQAKAAVRWMEDMNLLDDRKTAEQIVRGCISKGYGLAWAKQALYEKRIPKELWEEALCDYPDQLERIVEFLRSRLHGSADAREQKRAVDALLRKGHSYSQIRQAMEQLQMDAAEYPEEY